MNDKTASIRVLLIEEHGLFREALKIVIETEPEFQVVAGANSLESGIGLLRESAIDAAVVNLRLFQQTGTFILGTLKRDNAKLRIVALSPDKESDLALEALRSGAHGIVDIRASSATLRDTIRSVARGSIVLDVLAPV